MLTWKSAKRSGRHNALPWGPSDRLQRKGFLVGELSFPVLSRTDEVQRGLVSCRSDLGLTGQIGSHTACEERRRSVVAVGESVRVYLVRGPPEDLGSARPHPVARPAPTRWAYRLDSALGLDLPWPYSFSTPGAATDPHDQRAEFYGPFVDSRGACWWLGLRTRTQILVCELLDRLRSGGATGVVQRALHNCGVRPCSREGAHVLEVAGRDPRASGIVPADRGTVGGDMPLTVAVVPVIKRSPAPVDSSQSVLSASI
jgi:hypothetical protein